MEATDPDDVDVIRLVEQYLPHRIPVVTWEDRVSGYWGGAVLGLFCVAMLAGAFGVPIAGGASAVVVMVALAAVVIGGVELMLRRSLGRRRAQLREDTASGQLLVEVAAAFRSEIEDYRSRTLGSASEWAQARAPLAEAQDEANRSAAYWSERAADEGQRDTALAQAQLAKYLEDKFARAVAQIDERAAALRRFFNRCEARIARLERSTRDREELDRLAHLSDRAEVEIGAAHDAITRIGVEFASDALRVGHAITGLQRVQLLDQAELLDLNELESVAERIAAASASGHEELRALEEQLGAGR